MTSPETEEENRCYYVGESLELTESCEKLRCQQFCVEINRAIDQEKLIAQFNRQKDLQGVHNNFYKEIPFCKGDYSSHKLH